MCNILHKYNDCIILSILGFFILGIWTCIFLFCTSVLLLHIKATIFQNIMLQIHIILYCNWIVTQIMSFVILYLNKRSNVYSEDIVSRQVIKILFFDQLIFISYNCLISYYVAEINYYDIGKTIMIYITLILYLIASIVGWGFILYDFRKIYRLKQQSQENV